MHRRLRQQWLLLPFLIFITFSAPFFFLKNHQQSMSVYYIRTTETSFSILPVKHVTKSLSELGKMDDINKFVILLNQIPNCGAEVLIFLLQKMQGFNNYRHVRLKGGFNGNLNNTQQEDFVNEVYQIMRKEAVPLSFDRQLFFVNFSLFDKQSPTYINLIREPADKAISRSFYHNKQRDNEDLIGCIISGKANCTHLKARPDQLTIPFFCGHDPKCLTDGEWALQTAKNNVRRYYPVVGILEEMNATLEVLEHQLPYFFKGVQNIYRKKIMARFAKKKAPQIQPNVRKQLRRILTKEFDFYNWVKRRLFQQLQILDYHSH